MKEEQSIPGTPLPFERMENFRQLGGYIGAGGKRVKQNIFYRSGALCNAVKTPYDKNLLESLRIKVICDFRSDQEKRQQPDPELPGVRRIDFSVFTMDHFNLDLTSFFLMSAEDFEQQINLLRQGYARMPFGSRAYQEMFRAICTGEVPLLFHCTAGKDRTGVAAMLILKSLGVSDDDIIEDYMKTNKCTRHTRAALTEKFYASAGGQLNSVHKKLVDCLVGVEADNLRLAINAISERYDTFEDYLNAEYGVDGPMLAQMRETYLE